MPRTCTVCQHPDHDAINAALVDRMSLRGIARKYFGTVDAEDALARHKAEHLPAALAKAKEAQEAALADDLFAQLKQLRNKAISILLKAEGAGDLRTALLGIRESRACIELLAEMEGELNRNPVVNIHLSAEWLQVRTRLLHALSEYPEARASVARALLEVDGGAE